MRLIDLPAFKSWRSLKSIEAGDPSQLLNPLLERFKREVMQTCHQCVELRLGLNDGYFTLDDERLIIDWFKGSPNLQHLYLFGTLPFDRIFDMMLTLPNLTTLITSYKIVDTLIDTIGTQYDSNVLNMLPKLLNLSVQGIVSLHITNFPNNLISFSTNHTLTKQYEIQQLSVFLLKSQSIQKLVFKQASITSFSVSPILKSIKTYQYLITLEIEMNGLTPICMENLEAIIKRNQYLVQFTIINQDLIPSTNLINILANHAYIESLTLMIQSNTTLMTRLCELIEQNSILSNLTVSFGKMNSKQLDELFNALNHNLTLERITINYFQLSHRMRSLCKIKLEDLHRYNPAFTILPIPVNDTQNVLKERFDYEARYVIFGRSLLLFEQILSSDIIHYILQLLLFPFPSHQPLLSSVILNRESIGWLVSSSLNPFGYGELIRVCARFINLKT
ncbi:hypothetical protein BC833DRAFT_618276 [Globomyces pollinis-pini]|nr:hypothetical protein BC833DRAFT_618276 [Globomyces pollinis-pini]